MMKRKTATVEQLKQLLREQIAAAGSQQAWAHAHGVNQGTVSKAINGGSEITGAAMLRSLGYERVVVYREVKDSD